MSVGCGNAFLSMTVISRVGGEEEIQLSFSLNPNSLKTGVPSGGKAGALVGDRPSPTPKCGPRSQCLLNKSLFLHLSPFLECDSWGRCCAGEFEQHLALNSLL